MELALDELYRSQKYHLKQLEENLQSIRSKEEAIQMLKEANEKEKRIIEQINQAINLIKWGKVSDDLYLIKMDIDFAESIPTEKQPTEIITGGNENDNLPHK